MAGMVEDKLEKHHFLLRLNQQACLAAIDEDQLENHHYRCCLNQQACLAAMNEDELENHCSWCRQNQQARLVDMDKCRYRFSGKPISTYMSLTFARLCGEWQLVSRNYEARGASVRKYKAQIVIFCILAAVNRFSRISRKVENH